MRQPFVINVREANRLPKSSVFSGGRKSRKRKADKSAAIITIKAPGRMPKKGRKDIAAWLRKHADHLVRHGNQYTHGKFTGRYIYV